MAGGGGRHGIARLGKEGEERIKLVKEGGGYMRRPRKRCCRIKLGTLRVPLSPFLASRRGCAEHSLSAIRFGGSLPIPQPRHAKSSGGDAKDKPFVPQIAKLKDPIDEPWMTFEFKYLSRGMPLNPFSY